MRWYPAIIFPIIAFIALFWFWGELPAAWAASGKPFISSNAATTPAKLAEIVESGNGLTVPVNDYLETFRKLGYREEARDPHTFSEWMREHIATIRCEELREDERWMYVHLVAPNDTTTLANFQKCRPGETFGRAKNGTIVVKIGCGNPVGKSVRSEAPHTAEKRPSQNAVVCEEDEDFDEEGGFVGPIGRWHRSHRNANCPPFIIPPAQLEHHQ